MMIEASGTASSSASPMTKETGACETFASLTTGANSCAMSCDHVSHLPTHPTDPCVDTQLPPMHHSCQCSRGMRDLCMLFRTGASSCAMSCDHVSTYYQSPTHVWTHNFVLCITHDKCDRCNRDLCLLFHQVPTHLQYHANIDAHICSPQPMLGHTMKSLLNS